MSKRNQERNRNQLKQKRQPRTSSVIKFEIGSPFVLSDTDEAIRIYYPSGPGMLIGSGATIRVGRLPDLVVMVEPKFARDAMMCIDPRCVVVLDEGDDDSVPLYDPRMFRHYMDRNFAKTLDQGWPERVLGSNRPPARRGYREGVASPPPGCLWI